MKLFVQNMVSQRCKLIVKDELQKRGLLFTDIQLGEVNLVNAISENDRDSLALALHFYGLELLKDKDAIIIEKIKNIIVEMVHYSDALPLVKISVYLSEKLNLDYHYLSNLFSRTKGITIEHFILLHKIEKVKELIMYNELNLTEIANLMQYSSVAHLSNQFKKITGLTPSYFKNFKKRKRSNLEDL
jgi:AraC-like DNA-binding protein